MTTVAIVSLGCAKNQVDSEEACVIMERAGFVLVEEPERAEVIIVNTCAFIESALEESIETLLSLAQYKKKGLCRALLALGCLAERYREELLREIPELDGIAGVNAREQLPGLIEKALQGEKTALFCRQPWGEQKLTLRRARGPWAYLKIAEGCSRRCSYCIIPSLRGGLSSRSVAELTAETRALVSQGVKEINLIAQDTTCYGLDRGESLPKLLQSLSELAGLDWIRILYAHPGGVGAELLSAMASHSNICSYLDIPFQHAHERVLKDMGRGGNGEQFLDLIKRLRNTVPGITLRSTFIVGFPGESEREFTELLDFLTEARLEKVGFFAYSPEEGTAAATMSDQVDEEEKQERLYRAERLQEQISSELQQQKMGKVLTVLIEKQLQDNLWQGREEGMAPEVDGSLLVTSRELLTPGEFVPVKITGSDPFDLQGEVNR